MDRIPADVAERLKAFRSAIERALPGLVNEVVLFGSRARGDARADSDYDVAVFVSGGGERSAELKGVVSDHAFAHTIEGYPFSAIVLPDRDLHPCGGRYRTELARRIASEGVTVL